MKTIKPSEINRTIAAILEPNPEWPCTDNGWRQSRLKSWAGFFGSNGGLESSEPLNFEHDPRGTIMLLEHMKGDVFYSDWPHSIASGKEGSIGWLASAKGFHNEQSEGHTIGEAVTRAFLLAHNITVEE